MKKIFRWLCGVVGRHEGLVAVLILVTLLRIPSLHEPNRYADEDIYLTLGMGLRQGLVFYKDIHDNKPPLLYLMAALTGSVVYFRLLLLGWNLLNIVFIWKIAKKIIMKKWIVFGAVMLFGVFSSIPLLEGNIANGEIFMILPTTVAVWLLLTIKKRTEELWKYYLIGGFLALGFLFKVPVAFEFLAILYWISFYQLSSIRGVFRVFADKRIWIMILGFVLPIAISIGYYGLAGAGESYVRAALMQNVGYVSSWEGQAKPFYQSGLFIRGVIWAISILVITMLRGKIKLKFGLAALWFGGALFGAFLSGRPYPHYLIEIVPPGVLLLGLLADKFNLAKLTSAIFLFGLLGVGVFYYKFWYYESWSYYKNFLLYTTGDRSEKEYRGYFGGGVNRNYEVASYIRERTQENEKIFVWGTEPAIYVLADRLPVGKYTVAYHYADFGGQDEVYQKMLIEPPKYIVIIDGERTRFDQLWSLLEANYIKTAIIQGTEIWRKR
jgi:hypothetical protein